jgi:hypothetical protein
VAYNRLFLSHQGSDKGTVREYFDLLTAIGLGVI